MDSLVREFTKMNTPVNTGKKSLLDWGEIYSEKDEWEKTKAEVHLSNQAFHDNADIEVERISNMLEDEFDDHFYIYHPTNNQIKYGWTWYICPHEKTDKLFIIDMVYTKDYVKNASNTHEVYLYKSIKFKHSERSYSHAGFDSIEKLFEDEPIINKIKSYINK
jgi:hypothetical protein